MCGKPRLHLETPRSSPSTSPLEFPSLALDVRFLVLVRTHSEMFDRLSRILGSAQQDAVAACGCTQSQLVDRERLATGLFDASAGRGGKSECRDAQLGHGEEADVIGHGPNDDEGFGGLGGARSMCGQAREGEGWAVDARHEEASEHDFVECGVRTTCQI